MHLQEWEGTIQKMVAEYGQKQNGADRILTAWRAKLEKEPTLLQPFQIDQIIREARGRLSHRIR